MWVLNNLLPALMWVVGGKMAQDTKVKDNSWNATKMTIFFVFCVPFLRPTPTQGWEAWVVRAGVFMAAFLSLKQWNKSSKLVLNLQNKDLQSFYLLEWSLSCGTTISIGSYFWFTFTTAIPDGKDKTDKQHGTGENSRCSIRRRRNLHHLHPGIHIWISFQESNFLAGVGFEEQLSFVGAGANVGLQDYLNKEKVIAYHVFSIEIIRRSAQ